MPVKRTAPGAWQVPDEDQPSSFAGTHVIAEYNALATPPTLLREYVYAGGEMLTLEETSTTYFLRDHLSVRVLTDSLGNKIGEQAHYPYGEDWYLHDTTTNQIFTSYPHEPESGNDYAMARTYANRFGRFTAPDPVRYGITNPQNLNRYAYVRNSPNNLTDPTGRMTMGEPGTCLFLMNLDGGKSCGNSAGGGGGWGPGGAEPPLPGLLPGGGFGGGPLPGSGGGGFGGGFGGGGSGGGSGSWGPAGAPSGGGPMDPGLLGLLDSPGDPSGDCEAQYAYCLAKAQAEYNACTGAAWASDSLRKDVCDALLWIPYLQPALFLPLLPLANPIGVTECYNYSEGLHRDDLLKCESQLAGRQANCSAKKTLCKMGV